MGALLFLVLSIAEHSHEEKFAEHAKCVMEETGFVSYIKLFHSHNVLLVRHNLPSI